MHSEVLTVFVSLKSNLSLQKCRLQLFHFYAQSLLVIREHTEAIDKNEKSTYKTTEDIL